MCIEQVKLRTMVVKYLFILIAGSTISVSLAAQQTSIETIINEWREHANELELRGEEVTRTLDVEPIEIKEEDIEKLLKKLIEVVRPVIKFQDPYFVEHFEFNTDTSILKLKGSLDKAKLSGFGDFSEDKLNVTKNLDFDLGFGVTSIMADGYYDLDFNVLTLLPIYGNGQFGILLSGFNISLATTLVKGNNDILQAQNFNLDFKVGKVDLEINGLLGGGKLGKFVNDVLSDVAAEIIMDYKGTLLDIINPVLKYELNSYMVAYNVTLDNAINTIEEIINHLDPTPTPHTE